MAAPTLVPRSGSGHVPAGIPLDNGHSSVIRCAADPDMEAWCMTVKPPSLDGGDPVSTTTMENVTWRTKGPGALLDLTDATCQCGYDPNLYNSALAIINVRTTFTHHFPDGSTLTFYGYLRSANFGQLAENQKPTVDLTIIPTNWDHVNNVEAGPVLTSVPGT